MTKHKTRNSDAKKETRSPSIRTNRARIAPKTTASAESRQNHAYSGIRSIRNSVWKVVEIAVVTMSIASSTASEMNATLMRRSTDLFELEYESSDGIESKVCAQYQRFA